MNEPRQVVNHSFSPVLSRSAFVTFICFVLWQSGPPFVDKIDNVNELSASNLVNQIVISLLFLAAVVTLFPKFNELKDLVKKEKYLFLFLLWSLFSVIWSDFKFVSFKRYFQILVYVMISCSFLLHARSFVDILKYLKPIFFVYISLTILAIIFVPAAIDTSFDSWRGLTSQKNQLGQVSLVSLIIWAYVFHLGVGKEKSIALIMGVASLILLFGSESSTSIIAFGVLAIVMAMVKIHEKLATIGVGWFYSVLSGVTIFVTVSIILINDSSIITTNLPAVFGKNISFSGRDIIWLYVLDEIKNHIFLGCGFGGFWVIGNSKVLSLYENLNIIIFQGHMGYIDLLNEVGLIGLMLFIMIIFKYFKSSLGDKSNYLILSFLVIGIVINFQETIIFRPNNLVGIMFIFFYLALHIPHLD